MVHLSGSTRFLTPIWSFFFFSSLSSQETMAANTATRIPAWRVFEIFMLHQYLWMESKECFLSEFQSLMRDDMSPLYLSLIFLFFTSLPSQVKKFGMFRYIQMNTLGLHVNLKCPGTRYFIVTETLITSAEFWHQVLWHKNPAHLVSTDWAKGSSTH